MAYPESTLLTPAEVITPTSGKRAELGTRGYTLDGRVFHYARANTTTLNKGKLCQSRAEASPGEGWGGATGMYWSTAQLATVGATSYLAGTTVVYLGCTCQTDLDVTADYFADGWLYIGLATTEAGQLVKIASNTTGSTGTASDYVKVQFAPGHTFSEVVDTGSCVRMCLNEYSLVEVHDSPPTGLLVGVPCSQVTGSYYFWLQTWGPCAVLTGSDTIVGEIMVPSSQTDGAIASATGATGYADGVAGIGPIGYAMDVHGASGSWQLVFLTLAP